MRTATILLALAWLACSTAFADNDAERDAAVYAAVFTALSAGAQSPPAIVVRDRTATVREMTKAADPRTAAAEFRQRMPQASEALVAELVAKAAEPHALTRADLAKASSVKAELVDEAEVRHAFDDPKVPIAEAWRRLAEKHGGAHSVVTLSPVAYDAAGQVALVFLAVECGGLCGGGSLMRLELKDGAWRAAQTQPLWVS